MSKQPVFGDILRAARKAQGITQDELEARSGVSRSAISNVERGASTKYEIMLMLAEGLGLDLKIELAPRAIEPLQEKIYDFRSYLEGASPASDLVLGFKPKER